MRRFLGGLPQSVLGACVTMHLYDEEGLGGPLGGEPL